MNRTTPVVLGGAALALSACGAGTAYTSAPTTTAPAPAAHGGGARTALAVRSTGLGSIVTAGGRTVYVYDVDHQGTRRSACTGACASAWPLVTFRGTASTPIKASGVTGRLGSIAVSPGVRQVTLDGRPLYYYAGDTATGDINGQGSGGIWWVVDAAGSRIKAAGSARGY